MICVGFHVLLGLSFVLFSCEGQNVSPPSNKSIIVLPGSTARLKWTFVGDPSKATLSWFFIRRGGSKGEELAVKFRTTDAIIQNSSLPGVAIETPATLVLKNVDERYNGKYKMDVQVGGGGGEASVEVFIAVTPTVTLSCSSPVTVNESDNVTCVCRGKSGNPPANVTWYKDGIQIGGTGKEKQTLTLRNVNRADSGTYKCVAQSHINATDEKSIKVIVIFNFKPNNTTLTANIAVVGTLVVMTCKSEGLPEPRYTITRNGIVVSTKKTYAISEVMGSDAGTCTYKCIALNKLGNDSACSNLTVVEPRPPTTRPPTTKPSAKPSSPSTSKKFTTTSPAANKEDDGTTVVVWHTVVTLVSGFILGILFSYIVSCSRRRWFRNRKPEPKTTEVDTTYQELDLSKMNTEDNYQSLRVNAERNDAAANDDDSTYTELSKTRDVENNYQSLT